MSMYIERICIVCVHMCVCACLSTKYLHLAAVPHLKSSSSSAHSSMQTRPILGSQIVIQSEQEKQLKKSLRKEEKRIAKQVKDLQAAGVEDHETQLQILGYNPDELRRERLASVVIRVSRDCDDDQSE